MKATINPTTRAKRRYFLEFGLSMGAYVVVVAVTRAYCGNLHGIWQIVVALAPVIPIALVFAAIVRLIGATDEFQRRIYIESLAMAGGITALAAVTYGFLEGDVLPRPSAWFTYLLFMGAWLVCATVLRLRYR